MQLFGTYRSRASRNIWFLHEAGLPFEMVTVWQARRLAEPTADGAPLNTASPEFLRLSPMGAIPVLVDGDLTLTESLAINLHLARRAGELGPRDDAEAALMAQWALFAATSVEGPALAIVNAHDDGRAGSPEGDAAIAAEAGRLRRPLAALEAHLSAHPFMVGGRFTVADVNTAEVLRYAQGHPTLIAEHPALDAWLRGCQGRPAFRRFWAEREAEPASP